MRKYCYERFFQTTVEKTRNIMLETKGILAMQFLFGMHNVISDVNTACQDKEWNNVQK